jgi:iron complex transport system substrate-binding protein
MTRKLLPLLSLLVLLPALACGGDSDEPSAESAPEGVYPLTLRQADGQQLTLAQRPERIVSLSAHATEVFCALGAGSQLVAVDEYANCPAGSSAKPELDAFSPNLEAIAAYRPDLVYIATNSGEVVQGLRRLNIPVLYLELPTTIQGVLEQIGMLGSVAGRQEEAGKLVKSMEQRLEAVRAKVDSVTQGPRIYHELDTSYFSAGPSSFIGDLYIYLKGQNIAAGASSDYPQLSAEVIIQRDPQVIILADEAAGVTVESLKQRPGWGVIDAVRNNRVCVVDPDIVSRPGPRIVDALDLLAKCMYPQIFQ